MLIDDFYNSYKILIPSMNPNELMLLDVQILAMIAQVYELIRIMNERVDEIKKTEQFQPS